MTPILIDPGAFRDLIDVAQGGRRNRLPIKVTR